MKTTLYQIELDYSNIDCGMSYVFHLQDGRFFIIDGGFSTPGEEDRLFELLERLSDGVPTIAGWFFSHAHDDHIGNFTQLIKKYNDRVSIERLIYNFQTLDLTNCYIDWKSYDLEVINEFNKTIDEHCKDIPIYTPRTGDIFQVGEIAVEVLYTHEDSDVKEPKFNDCTTVITTEYAGQKILWLGDIDEEGSRILLQNNKDKLLCDIVQVSHHGFAGATKEIYAATHAKAALWPTPDYLMSDIARNSAFLRNNHINLFILNEMNIKEHWVSGYGTVEVALPYKFDTVKSYPKKFFGCADIYIKNNVV